MRELIPAFSWERVVLAPWTSEISTTLWIVLMGFFVTTACGLVGNYLILRRMALVGDAISHSILPGLVVAFLVLYRLAPPESQEAVQAWRPAAMFAGALAAALLTTVLIEWIHRKSRVKQDAAIGITFSTLFAVGVILISLYADKVDLDQECVLYGEIAYVPLEPMVRWGGWTLGPEPVVQMAVVALVTGVLILVFYKELLVSSFDPGLAVSMGINATVVHYSLMSMLAIVVVSAFESVGAILVIAMLILPGATASLLSTRFPVILGLTGLHALLSSTLGLHLALWLDCSTAGAMVVVGTILFVLAWILSPSQGLFRKRARLEPPPELFLETPPELSAPGPLSQKP